jgi:predicted transposase/invertase (TIGR01784 family)
VEYLRVQRALLEHSRQEGREEGKLEVARGLRRLGLPVEVIAEATGLVRERIEGL